MRGSDALLTLASLDCFREGKNGEVVYWAVVDMDPGDSASGKPVAWLAHVDSMRVGIELIPTNSTITRGQGPGHYQRFHPNRDHHSAAGA
jgi:hypothetical protein